MKKFVEIDKAIRRALPGSEVTIEDMTGSGDHLQISVTSNQFAGLSLIRQHQLIYAALKEELASEAIHALALNTSTPN